MKYSQDCVKQFHDHVQVSKDTVFPSACKSPQTNIKCIEIGMALRSIANHLEPTIDTDERILRSHLMIEELGELIEAMGRCNEEQAFDGLCDLLYVVLGTAVTYDWPAHEGFDAVHKSNMTKKKQPTDPSASRVRQKGPNYQPPDLKSILERHRGA